MSVTLIRKPFTALTELPSDTNAVLQGDGALLSQLAATWWTQFSSNPGSGVGAPIHVAANVGTVAVATGKAAAVATATPSTAASVSVGAPAWIASLSDAVIKADMTTASAGGTVSETAMAKLFSDLSAELTAGKTTLSASQFNDLKTIAADLNVGETASSYVTYITDALVYGNTANAKWTGGAASASTLGNLAVGCTATQVLELDDKWFLGSDLPSSTVQMSGVSTFHVTYSTVASPLFGASGPSMNDINQGYLGDCYLLSSLAEVAKQNPSVIQSMITDNGNGTYGVRFFVNGSAEYVTVNNALANSGTIFNSATDIWASLVEKAYAQIQASGIITGNNINYGNSFSTIGNGGAPEYALEEVTGASTITDFDASGSSWTKEVYNSAFANLSASSGLTTASVLGILIGDLAAGNDLVLSSYTNATDSSGRTTLVADHAMSIYGYDSATGLLEIRNPWGSENGQYWDTTFEVNLSTLLADGDTISVDNLTTVSASVVTGALVSAAAGLQASTTVTSFSIADTAANVSAALDSLNSDSKLSAITLTDTAAPTLALTAARYSADAGALAKITSSYNLTVTGALVSAATGLQANSHVTAFAISDSAANVSAAFASLSSDSKLSSIVLTDAGTPSFALTSAQYSADVGVLAKISGAYNLTVSGALASAAAGLQANSHVTAFSVSDSAANVAGNIAALNADTKLSSIAMTDSNLLSITYAQLVSNTSALSKLPTAYKLSVSSVTVANAAVVQANAHVTGFLVSDSSVNVAGNIAALNGDTKLSSIALTDSDPLSITYAQLIGDTTALSKLPAAYKLSVSGVTAANAAAVQANSHVTAFSVSDNSAYVAGNIATLNGDTKLSSIALTDSNPLSITYAQLIGDATALSKLPTTYKLSVSGVATTNAAAMQANTHVAAFSVSDSSANVTSTLSTLNADSKLSALAVSGTTSADTLVLTGSKIAAAINLNGDSGSAITGLNAPSLSFLGNRDAITLGSGAATISYALQPSSGIETIANFLYGQDQLNIDLAGASNGVLRASDTTVSGVHAIALYSSSDITHGVVLTGISPSLTAANLLASHTTYSNGHALIG